jgi:sugar lactone lactonase YvrE
LGVGIPMNSSSMRRIVAGLSFSVLCARVGLAQTYTISTYVGSTYAVDGAFASTQVIDTPSGIASDGSGGYYVTSGDQGRVYRVSADGTIRRIAGTDWGYSGDGGPATNAQLNDPHGVAVDSVGNVFVADTHNNCIRKIDPDGIITTVLAGLSMPHGVAVDAADNVFVADTFNRRILVITRSGIDTVSAGFLSRPYGVATDSAGNLFIADTDALKIRKLDAKGVVTTVAGGGSEAIPESGISALRAQLTYPYSLTVDSVGNLWIADTQASRIRKVSPDGIITNVAGAGPLDGYSGDNGPATSARVKNPQGITIDTSGNVLIADTGNNRVRKVTADGVITTVAGNGRRVVDNSGFSGDGGTASLAQLSSPTSAAVDSAGNLFISDSNNRRVRKVTPDGVISTVAGNGQIDFSGDGGPAVSAQIGGPGGLVVDAAGNLFIAANNRIRKVTPDGIINTIVGDGVIGFKGDGGPALSAQLHGPAFLALDAAGNLFFSDWGNHRVRKVTPAGVITTVAGGGPPSFDLGDGGPATLAYLPYPTGIAIDSAGNLFIAETNRIRKVNAAGIISTFAGGQPPTNVNWISAGPEVLGDGGPANNAFIMDPMGLALDTSGNLFIVDQRSSRVRRVSPDNVITTVAGSGFFLKPISSPHGFSGDGGPATVAELRDPTDITIDSAGNVFVVDYRNHRVRKLTPPPSVLTFNIVDGGVVARSTLGVSGSASAVGYASIRVNSREPAPSGFAVFRVRQDNVLVSEATIPASSLIRQGRIYVEMSPRVRTGLAIINPNSQTTTVTFFFSDSRGDTGRGQFIIPANGQIAAFLNEQPFNGRESSIGSFTFSSSLPVSAIALRGFTNERSEFLITTLPVRDLSIPAVQTPVVLPGFADGGGWTTQLLLVNPTDNALTGSIQFRNQTGQPVDNVNYSIQPRASQKLETSGAPSAPVSGSIRVVPSLNTAVPDGLLVFTFRNRGVIVTQAGVPFVPAAHTLRLYAEANGDFEHGIAGSIQTGVALANPSSDPITASVELDNSDGSATGLTGNITVPGNGQVTLFLRQIEGFGSLAAPFRGVLRLLSPAPISVVGIRGRYNERDDFLATVIPPVSDTPTPSHSVVFFPYIVDSSSYTTEFILFGRRPGENSSGTLEFFSQSGRPWHLLTTQEARD